MKPAADYLEPCPFCGAHLKFDPAMGRMTSATFTHPGPPGGDWDKACIMTGVIVRDAERIAAWNRRASPSPPPSDSEAA